MKTRIKNYSSRILAIIVLVMSVSLLQAQPPGGQGGQRGGPPPLPNDKQIEKMVADLTKDLSLTEDQEKQVSDAYFAHFDEVAEMQEKNSRPDRDVMEQMESDFESEVKSYLTKDQQKKYDKYLKKQKSQRGGGEDRPQR